MNLSILSSQLANAKGPVHLRTLELLFDQMPDTVFFVKDRSGRYQSVNHTLLDRCGLIHKSDLLGRRVNDVFPHDLACGYAAQDDRVLRGGSPVLNRLELHWYARRRAGWCLTTKLPLMDESGAIMGLIGISRDLHEASDRGSIPPGLADALEFLESHCGENMTPALLAGRAGLSVPKFARLITRVFRATPSQIIAKARLSKGMELLRLSKQSVAEIALECGYYDHSAFTRAFRQAAGITPTEFRVQALA